MISHLSRHRISGLTLSIKSTAVYILRPTCIFLPEHPAVDQLVNFLDKGPDCSRLRCFPGWGKLAPRRGQKLECHL